MRQKRGLMIQDYLGWIIIAVLVLVIGLIFYAIQTGKLQELGEFIKNIFKFRR